MDLEIDISKNRAALYRILGIQILITALISLLLFALFGQVSAYSALLGGFAYIIPAAWFARLAFRGRRITAQSIINRFYIGEAVKLIFTGIIFALIFLLVAPVNIGALFLTYVLMMIINLAGLARLNFEIEDKTK